MKAGSMTPLFFAESIASGLGWQTVQSPIFPKAGQQKKPGTEGAGFHIVIPEAIKLLPAATCR